MVLVIEIIGDELTEKLGYWVHIPDVGFEALHLSRRHARVEALGENLRCGLLHEQLCGFGL